MRPNEAGRSFACRNFFGRNISARAKITKTSSWLKKCPVDRQSRLVSSRASLALSSSHHFSRNDAPAFITTPPPLSTRTENFLANTARCTFPMIRCIMRSFISRQAILAFRRGKPQHGKIGVCICWDQWYPEAARLTALRGAEIIFYPTAIGWHPSEKEEFGDAQHSAWETIQRSHAIANGCYVAAANRVGHEAPAGGPGIEFWGQSFICGPDGEIIAKGSVDREEIVLADVDWQDVDRHRTHWPFLRDRRVDAYGDMNQRLVD